MIQFPYYIVHFSLMLYLVAGEILIFFFTICVLVTKILQQNKPDMIYVLAMLKLLIFRKKNNAA